jgi:hypothetical protein
MGTRSERESAPVSDPDHIVQKASPGKFSFGLKNFSLVIDVEAADYPAANGFVLFFEDAWSTVATITRAHRIVGGGGYSGCMYSVYNAGGGQFKCFHTARPGGVNADTYLNYLRVYAAAQNWQLIHEVPTVGVTAPGQTVFTLTRVSYTVNPVKVRTVRLVLNQQGMSVRRDRWNTPAP